MKLFLKISNLCNHNTSTLRTDRQTDGQTTCHSNTALCVLSRGKKGLKKIMQPNWLKTSGKTVLLLKRYVAMSSISSFALMTNYLLQPIANIDICKFLPQTAQVKFYWIECDSLFILLLWGIKNCTLLTRTITLQNYAILWWFLAYRSIRCTREYSIACLFDSLCKIENWEQAYQICYCLAYLVGDNNVKCETIAATRDRRLHHSRPMAS